MLIHTENGLLVWFVVENSVLEVAVEENPENFAKGLEAAVAAGLAEV